MRCTVDELGERMSAHEFGLWLTWLEREPCDPVSELQRWASLMAGTANGPMTKRDKALFTRADFLAADRWKPPPAPAPPQSRAKFAAGLRAFFKKR